MYKIIKDIDEIQELIFKFDIKTAMNYIVELSDRLLSLSESLNSNELQELGEIFNYLNVALSNKDYLLYSDILEFDVKKFINKRCMNS